MSFTRRRIWRVSGKVKKAEDQSYYQAERRVVFLVARDFDEAADLAKPLLTETWSSRPHDAIITEITPIILRKGDEDDQVVYVTLEDDAEAEARRERFGEVMRERFIDMEGAVRRIQALLGEDDSVTTDQAAEIATLATVLEHLVKGDPGCNDDTDADRAVRQVRSMT